MHELNYWEQLQALSVYSLESRRERYLIIYVWRIMEGQVPNIFSADNGGIRTKWHIRRVGWCSIPTVSNHSSQAIKSLRYASFAIHAPGLFNALPTILLKPSSHCGMQVLQYMLHDCLVPYQHMSETSPAALWTLSRDNLINISELCQMSLR